MKRFVHKLDHSLNILLNTDKEKAQELWQKIKNRTYIINQSREVIKDKRGNKHVLAPSICHMILSNPNDIDKEDYNRFALEVLRDKYLSRLVAAENLSYASLILLYGSNNLNILPYKALCSEISKKSSYNPYLTRYVSYFDMLLEDDMKYNARYRDENIEVKLTNNEVDKYLKGKHILIQEDLNFEEIDELMRRIMIDGEIDATLRKVVIELYQNSLRYRVENDIDYGIDEVTPKL